MHYPLRGTTAATALFVALSATGQAQASGFQLKEQSADGLGTAFAGVTAKAQDLSTIFYNPAGLARLETGAELSISYIAPETTFTDSGTTTYGGTAPGGSNGGDAANNAVLPAFYAGYRIAPDMVLGVSVNTPYGLVTEYDDDWVGRFQAIKSDLKTYNVQPTLAYAVNDRLSIGGGLNIQRAEAELTQAINHTGIAASSAALAATGPGEGHSKLTGDDWGYGFSLGAHYAVNDNTKIGASYTSRIHHTLEGKVDYSNTPTYTALVPAAAPLANGLNAQFTDTDASAKLTTPDVASLGLHHQVTDSWAVMADVSWTNWSVFKSLHVQNPQGGTVSFKDESWNDSWFFALGTSYDVNDKWQVKAGIAHDQTPVPDSHRTPRIPDGDRTWIALGASYAMMPNVDLTAGYTHIFVDGVSINDTETNETLGISNTLVGSYESSINIVAIGATLRF